VSGTKSRQFGQGWVNSTRPLVHDSALGTGVEFNIALGGGVVGPWGRSTVITFSYDANLPSKDEARWGPSPGCREMIFGFRKRVFHQR
jgi:hypothetical protein